MENYQVIYLTGAPAAGKSSLGKRLQQLVSPLEVWEFGERLTAYLNRSSGKTLAQEDLRSRSSQVITPEAVAAVDEELITFVEASRQTQHVIIDSHPVTKESYGFRVTPFSLQRFAKLRPTQIWMLYTEPGVTMARIENDSRGRPQVSSEDARMHTFLQSSVAITYGMSLGLPVYFFDSSGDPEMLARSLSSRI